MESKVKICEWWTQEDEDKWSKEECERLGVKKELIFAMKKNQYFEDIKSKEWLESMKNGKKGKKDFKQERKEKRAKMKRLEARDKAKRIIEEYNKQIDNDRKDRKIN